MTEDQIKLEAVRLLDIIAAEFSSDPTSVQCFDLRIVSDVKAIADAARETKLLDEAWAAISDQRKLCG